MDTGIDTILNIDVLEGLRSLPDDSVDLIITSPPFNKGEWSLNRRQPSFTKRRRIDYGVYDDKLPPDEYERWQRAVLDECCRVIKPTGSIFYNHTDIHRDCLTVHPRFVWDYPVKQLIIWDKGSTPRLDKSYFLPCTDWIFWIKKTPDARPYFNRRDGVFVRNVWRFNPDRHSEHPAPFPLELPENCILTCSKEGDLVLDPFMGSGTTALAAKKHNRHYLGFELNEEYIKQANERLYHIGNA